MLGWSGGPRKVLRGSSPLPSRVHPARPTPPPRLPAGPCRPLRGSLAPLGLRPPQASRQGKPLPPGRSGGAPLHAQRQPPSGVFLGRGRETPCTKKNALNSHLTPTFTKFFLYLRPLAGSWLPLQGYLAPTASARDPANGRPPGLGPKHLGRPNLILFVMAIMQGITGKLSGKMGSAVFRVREGAQVVAQYNPVVKNPNTEGQQSSRAAFKLMSQLAAVMSPGFGTMGVTKRGGHGTPSKRNEFFKLNYGLVSTADTAQGVVATIPMEQLKLTSSFRNLGSMSLSASAGKIHVTINVPDTSVQSVRCILIGYPETNGVKQASIVSMADFPVSGSGVIESFSDIESGDYTVLAYGLIPTESAAGKISLDSIHTPADDDFVSAVELDKLVSDGAVVETMTIGDNVSIQS